MPAIAGPRPFQGGWQVEPAACFEEGACVLLPTLPVEIDGQEITGLVLEHGINPDNEVAVLIVPARKMPANHFVADRKEAPVWAIGTLNSWLLAQTPNPFVCASRRVTRLPGFSALETPRVNIGSPTKERAKESDLGRRRRIISDRLPRFIRTASVLHRSAFRNGNISDHDGSVTASGNGVEMRKTGWRIKFVQVLWTLASQMDYDVAAADLVP